MKVCQLLTTDSAGGLAKHVVELSNALSARINTVAICPQHFSSRFNGQVTHIPFLTKRRETNLLHTIRLWRILHAEKPNVIHAHGNTAALHLARISPFVSAACIGTIHWNLKKPRERRIYNRLDAVIGVSDEVLQGIHNPQCRVINHGIPVTPSPFSADEIRTRYKLPDSRPVAIAIGRLVKVKGFDILLQAWKEIDASLLLVGDGPQRSELEGIATSLGMIDRVVFTGQIDNATNLFPAVDLVIVSSLREGFGYVLAEALMHRKALISTSVTFARQRLPKSLLAEPGDGEQLQTLVKYALNNIDAVKAALFDAYQWAEQHLGIDNMANQTTGYYNDVIKSLK